MSIFLCHIKKKFCWFISFSSIDQSKNYSFQDKLKNISNIEFLRKLPDDPVFGIPDKS